jgi:hypothetical protein
MSALYPRQSNELLDLAQELLGELDNAIARRADREAIISVLWESISNLMDLPASKRRGVDLSNLEAPF